MAYDGHRPIIPGRDSKQTNIVTGEEEESNYSYSEGKNLSGQPLADMPTSGSHVPGEGYYPGDVAMTRRFDGSDPAGPMDPMNDSGMGADTSYMGRITWPDPVPGAEVLEDAGHLPREAEYSGFSNHFFQGVPSANPILDAGHGVRYEWEGGVQSGGGATAPMVNKGVGEAAEPLDDAGLDVPEGQEEIYGHYPAMEWRGVPSAKAL